MAEIAFQKIIDAVLDERRIFPARYLYRFSDLSDKETNLLRKIWPNISLLRRQALMEDLLEMGVKDYLLDFRHVCFLAVEDEDALVRLSAVQTLREYSDRIMIPLFLRLAGDDPDTAVRAASTAGLGAYVYEGEVDELPKKLQHMIEDKLLAIFNGSDDILVRRRALESLGYSSREEVPSLIEESYTSGSQDWLLSSLVAMGRSCNPNFESKVLSKLDDSRATVRAEAAYAAGEMTMKSAVPTLLELLQDDEDLVRAAVIWALGETGGEGVAEALEELLNKTEEDEEVDLLEEALENLAFVEEMDLIPLIDISEPGEDDWIELDLGVDGLELDEDD